MAQFNYGGNVYACVGRFLKRELRRNGIDQADFALEVGISDRTVRRWIYGEVHSLDVVVLIAEYFGVSVGDVLSDEDGRPFFLHKKRPERAKKPDRVTYTVILILKKRIFGALLHTKDCNIRAVRV